MGAEAFPFLCLSHEKVSAHFTPIKWWLFLKNIYWLLSVKETAIMIRNKRIVDEYTKDANEEEKKGMHNTTTLKGCVLCGTWMRCMRCVRVRVRVCDVYGMYAVSTPKTPTKKRKRVCTTPPL